MPLYECVFIARHDITPQQVEAIADQVAATVAAGGGEVKKREYWGLRTLAYKIKKNRKGHYMLLGIDAPVGAMPEVERQLRLNEDVLRSLTVRVEAIEEGPSAVLAKRNDDRSLRGPRPAGRFASGRSRDRGDEREEFRARSRDELDGLDEGEE
jgi:small subunit ribosomal protein S6